MTEEPLPPDEVLLRRLVESIPTPMLITTATGELQAANRPVLEYFGKTVEELKAWRSGDWIHPDDLPRAIEKWTEALRTGHPYEHESRHRRHDGLFRWMQVRVFPLRQTDGRIGHWLLLQNDVHDRKQVEQALAASERRLDEIVNCIPAMAWSARPDGSADFFNQHYLKYLGLTLEGARGWGWTTAVHPDDMPRLAGVWQSLLASGVPGETEARLRRFDGQYRYFLFRAQPLRDEAGAIVKWFGVNADIEDRKQAEEALAASERGLGQIVSSIPAPAWSARSDGSADFFNQRYLDYLGISSREAQDWGWTAAVHPDDLVGLTAAWRSMLVTGAAGEAEARVRRFDGEFRWFLFRAAPLRDESGNIVKWFGVNADIEEIKRAEEDRKRAESELRDTQTKLMQVARLMTMGQLTASIAHEVNQPLSGIITNANTGLRMLAASPPNVEGARETVRRTIRDGNRASEVIKRLRALFSGKALEVEPVDLNDAAQEVIALSMSRLLANRVTLRTELGDDLPAVRGDRIQLQQVILNLLQNASDAMNSVTDRPRDMVVRTERDGEDFLRLTVQDAGVGFDPDVAGRLFDAFFTTKGAGMGIGLSVCRTIIERHAGRIWCEVNDGPGARFSFCVPLALEVDGADGPAEAEKCARSEGGSR